jgi:glycosyltransferase involved in cell wall biosynthesis
VDDGRSGLLCPPDAEALGEALAGLAASRAARERLARGGLASVRARTWEAALGRLAEGWHLALAARAATAAPGTRAGSSAA